VAEQAANSNVPIAPVGRPRDSIARVLASVPLVSEFSSLGLHDSGHLLDAGEGVL